MNLAISSALYLKLYTKKILLLAAIAVLAAVVVLYLAWISFRAFREMRDGREYHATGDDFEKFSADNR